MVTEWKEGYGLIVEHAEVVASVNVLLLFGLLALMVYADRQCYVVLGDFPRGGSQCS
jgi:hypothetical protein